MFSNDKWRVTGRLKLSWDKRTRIKYFSIVWDLNYYGFPIRNRALTKFMYFETVGHEYYVFNPDRIAVDIDDVQVYVWELMTGHGLTPFNFGVHSMDILRKFAQK